MVEASGSNPDLSILALFLFLLLIGILVGLYVYGGLEQKLFLPRILLLLAE
jgi:hypothetical protein